MTDKKQPTMLQRITALESGKPIDAKPADCSQCEVVKTLVTNQQALEKAFNLLVEQVSLLKSQVSSAVEHVVSDPVQTEPAKPKKKSS